MECLGDKKKKLENDILIKTLDNQIHLLNFIATEWICSYQTANCILENIKNNFSNYILNQLSIKLYFNCK